MVGANPVKAEAGIATVLVKTFPESGKIVITASANGLKTGVLDIMPIKAR